MLLLAAVADDGDDSGDADSDDASGGDADVSGDADADDGGGDALWRD